jgi:hypothetical protein
MVGMYSKMAGKKIGKVMREGMAGKLHAGSKMGPIVKKPAQMKAIALSEARQRGMKVPARKPDMTGMAKATMASKGRMMRGLEKRLAGKKF